MNDRQRDLFLWQWSQRRKRGLGRVTLLGTLVGAIGGLVFALVMMDMPEVGSRHGLSSLLTAIERSAQWLVLSIPPFTAIGMATAYRTFSRQELMYELLLKGGARVPDEKPVLQPGDRWLLYVVIATFIVLLGLIVALWVMVGTGSTSSTPAGVPAPDAPPIPAPPAAPGNFDFQAPVNRTGSSDREQDQED